VEISQQLQKALKFHQDGNLLLAKSLYLKILKIYPKHLDALQLLGTLAGQEGDYKASLSYLNLALEIRKNPTLLNNRGIVFKKLNRPNEALLDFQQAIFLNSEYAEAFFNLGNLYKELNNPAQAIAHYERAIELNGQYIEAFLNLGKVLEDNRELDKALEIYDLVLKINSQHAIAFYNRGNVKRKLFDFYGAIHDYDQAIKLKANYFEAFSNRGICFYHQHQIRQALSSFDDAIALNPTYANAHFGKGLVLLLQENYTDGWKEFEWRTRTEEFIQNSIQLNYPLCNSLNDVKNKTLFVRCEQGLGDTLQFMRYIPIILSLEIKVVFEVQQEIITLIQLFAFNMKIIRRGEPINAVDFQCPLMSLPFLLNNFVRNIPPPILIQQPTLSEKINHWTRKVSDIAGLKIGLVWSGNPKHANDYARSIKLQDLINNLPNNFQYISLQKDIRETDKHYLMNNSSIKNFSQHLFDFQDTAALISHLDLVITVDTSVAHLSCMLNKPTWILIPFAPDWRWQLEGDRSIWYPSAKLFRQENFGDWLTPLSKIRDNLLHLNLSDRSH
jgi:tetratricopeptide (TPR) repeat protein